jgi:hypothetical protein
LFLHKIICAVVLALVSEGALAAEHDLHHITIPKHQGTELAGESTSVDYMRQILGDWTEKYGTKRVDADLSDHLGGNTFRLGTGTWSLQLYFEPGGRAVWVQGGTIVDAGIWHPSVDPADVPTMCATYKTDEYCSYVYEWIEESPQTRMFLRAENDEGSSFNFWTGDLVEGKTPEVELAFQNEGPRDLMRKDGVDPEAYDRLVNAYQSYAGVAACEEAGIAFNGDEVKALEVYAKDIESMIDDESYHERAWDQASDAGNAARTLIRTNLSRGIETCNGMRFFVQEAINAHRPKSKKPF